MDIVLKVLLLAVGWVGGSFVFSYALNHYNEYKQSHNKTDLIMALVYVLVVVAVVGALMFTNLMSGVFLLIGVLIALFAVADPFSLTAEKAHEIGVQAAREAALKEQLEEQQRQEKKEKEENARIYREAKKANEKKNG
ncbi:MAG: hypothetical protein IKG53_10665 [Solobacterium sp.]|nr:hypothetical protein [Solobacterium sp.]